MSLADESQLPGEVEGVLQAAVHAVALRRRADVGRVARQQDTARAEARGDLGVAMETRRIA